MGKKRMGLGASVALGAVAGAVQGYGESMAAKGAMEGKAKYDMMVNQARSDLEFRNRMGELAVTQKFKASESQKTREASASENDKTRQTNLQLAGMKAKSGLLTPQQAYNMAVKDNTVEVPDAGGFTTKQVNKEGVYAAMTRMGFGDYADSLRGGPGDQAQGGGTGLDQETAFERAKSEAEDKNPIGPDWMRPGGMKEAYGDKSQEEWTTERARALMGGGNAAPGQPSKPNTQMANDAAPYQGSTPPPGFQNAKQGRDGNWYVQTGTGQGGKPIYSMVTMGSVAGASDESVKGGLKGKHGEY